MDSLKLEDMKWPHCHFPAALPEDMRLVRFLMAPGICYVESLLAQLPKIHRSYERAHNIDLLPPLSSVAVDM